MKKCIWIENEHSIHTPMPNSSKLYKEETIQLSEGEEYRQTNSDRWDVRKKIFTPQEVHVTFNFSAERMLGSPRHWPKKEWQGERNRTTFQFSFSRAHRQGHPHFLFTLSLDTHRSESPSLASSHFLGATGLLGNDIPYYRNWRPG